jgi:RHH-type proline utilization regulon transcriptional repressor/proline dehydrogenase/delta 1-pyrroline-5-carboxylate dehydrogenase
VLDAVYDTFVNRLVEVTKSLKIGPPEEPGNFVGPVIDADAHQRILKTIERAAGEGRQVYPAAGQLPTLDGSGGYFIQPHVFADVRPDSFLAQEEIFGPVLAVIRARDLDEALVIANGTQYALTGGCLTRSPSTIDRVRREFRVGNLYINRKITGALVERQPFGGYKLSGVGTKAGGPDYLQQFMWPRTITENTLRRGFAPETDEAAGGL